ncbi:MAG TPA: glucose-6-phosphate isomerase family protein, partial [Candidatus Dojkabacteria bacterium]|nr:glucose-6-phosphate isomerase family protein [Candidatus Dojkabacteria bacterium]
DNDSVFHEKNINVNLTVLPANLAGIEYTKTKGYVVKDYPRIVEIVNGSGTLLLQSFEKSFEGDIIQSTMKKGQKIIIPAGYYSSFINTRQTTLVLLEIYSKNAEELYDLDDMNGMSYYVIRKNAKQEIVRNPIYKMVNKGRKVQWDNLLSQFNITLKTPVTKQILRKYEKFSWLFKTSDISI